MKLWGGGNFVCSFIWRKQGGGKSDSKYVASNCEYILCYKKEKLLEFSKIKKDDSHYKNIDEDGKKYHLEKLDFGSLSYSTNLDYPITIDGYTFYAGGDKEKYLQRQAGNFTSKDWCWRCKEEEFWKRYNDNKFIIKTNPKTGIKTIQEKIYLSDEGVWGRFDTLITGYTNRLANNQIKDIFSGDRVFTYPKPINLIIDLMNLYPSKDFIILDSFAGSGTTAHAVLELNKKDGGNRKFILVEMEDYAENITAERVKRVIKGYGKEPENSATGGDFSFYELGDRLLEENGNINENISIEKIREYIYFSETKEKCEQNDSDFLGECNGVAYYFIYKKDDITTLDFEYLAKLKKASNYVIYADVCVLSDETMMKYNITFKKIPRDIKKV